MAGRGGALQDGVVVENISTGTAPVPEHSYQQHTKTLLQLALAAASEDTKQDGADKEDAAILAAELVTRRPYLWDRIDGSKRGEIVFDLLHEISEACITTPWTLAHTNRVRLLGALAIFDQDALSEIEEMVDYQYDRTANQVAMAVHLIRNIHTARLARAAAQGVRDGPASLAHISRELVETMWYSTFNSACEWVQYDVDVAAMVLSLVEVVVKAVPHSSSRMDDIQQIFQDLFPLVTAVECKPGGEVASTMSALAALIALMPVDNVNANAHSVLEVAVYALVHLTSINRDVVEHNVNHAADIQVACYDAVAAVGSKMHYNRLIRDYLELRLCKIMPLMAVHSNLEVGGSRQEDLHASLSRCLVALVVHSDGAFQSLCLPIRDESGQGVGQAERFRLLRMAADAATQVDRAQTLFKVVAGASAQGSPGREDALRLIVALLRLHDRVDPLSWHGMHHWLEGVRVRLERRIFNLWAVVLTRFATAVYNHLEDNTDGVALEHGMVGQGYGRGGGEAGLGGAHVMDYGDEAWGEGGMGGAGAAAHVSRFTAGVASAKVRAAREASHPGMEWLRSFSGQLEGLLWLDLVETECTGYKKEGRDWRPTPGLRDYHDPAESLLKDLAPVLPTTVQARLLRLGLQGILQRLECVATGGEREQMRVAASLVIAAEFAKTPGAFLLENDLLVLTSAFLSTPQKGYACWALLSAHVPSRAAVRLHTGAFACFGALTLVLDQPELDHLFLAKLVDGLVACGRLDEVKAVAHGAVGGAAGGVAGGQVGDGADKEGGHYDMPSVLLAGLQTVTAWARADRLSTSHALDLATALSALRPKLVHRDDATQLPGAYHHLRGELREALEALWPRLATANMPVEVRIFCEAYKSLPVQGDEAQDAAELLEAEQVESDKAAGMA